VCLEAAIYDFAAIHLGDQYVKYHIDKLDLLSKWVVVLRFVSGVIFDKGCALFASLKQLANDRNRLVHTKSKEFSGRLVYCNKAEIEHKNDVHNAFRSIVLISSMLHSEIVIKYNPLPSFDLKIRPCQDIPNILKSDILECRHKVRRLKSK